MNFSADVQSIPIVRVDFNDHGSFYMVKDELYFKNAMDILFKTALKKRNIYSNYGEVHLISIPSHFHQSSLKAYFADQPLLFFDSGVGHAVKFRVFKQHCH